MRRHLGQDLRNGVGRKSLAAPFLGDLEREEAFVAHEVPRLLGEILLHGNVVIVDQGAELIDLVVEEALFFGGQFGRVLVDELLQGRVAGKDVTIESDGSASERDLFRLGDGRHDALGHAVETAVKGLGDAQDGASLLVVEDAVVAAASGGEERAVGTQSRLGGGIILENVLGDHLGRRCCLLSSLLSVAVASKGFFSLWIDVCRCCVWLDCLLMAVSSFFELMNFL
mmetsp:Transcript_19757/g.55826  ORF Transcript_19757/g.55826 Transcript_19757/m.55826 type:complete len:227 (-) Transcript_19757:117-797(-)